MKGHMHICHMLNFKLYFALYYSELLEKSSKKVSAPQQSKKLCLTSSFERNNFVGWSAAWRRRAPNEESAKVTSTSGFQGAWQLRNHLVNPVQWYTGHCHWTRRLTCQSKFLVISKGRAPRNNTDYNADLWHVYRKNWDSILKMRYYSSRIMRSC